MIGQEWELVYYETESGNVPFREWFESLKDSKTQDILDARLLRLRSGNFGKYESLGLGLFELKIYYGPGYRIYFGIAGAKVILLLTGGNKSTQDKDIQTAHRYWKHFKEERE